MINQDKIQLIRHLKLKPKQGIFDLAAAIGGAVGAANSFSDSMHAINTTTNQLLLGFDEIRGANEQLTDSFKSVVAQSLKLENTNKSLNVAFGINSTTAAALAQTYYKLAQKFSISGDNMKKYGATIKSIIPTLNQNGKENDKYFTGLVAVQKVMKTNLGLTEEQAEEYTYYATQQGENAASSLLATQAVSDALDKKGEMGYFKIASAGIAKAGATIQLQYGKVAGNLELAVLKAHSLGLEVKHLAQMGTHLLDIESSIGDELEYQLLSGHRLTDASGKSLTNAYRTATMQGKASDQADIMNKLLEDEGTVLENNLFARQQMAKLMGIEEGELSRALQKKKLLKESGAEFLFKFSGDELKQQAAAAKAAGKLNEEGFNKIMAMQETRTSDEILTELLEVNQESAISNFLQTKQLALIAKSQGQVLKDAGDLKLMKYVEEEAASVGNAMMIAKSQELKATALLGKINDNLGKGSGAASAQPASETSLPAAGVMQDGLLVNDGLVNFNPRDQFMQVNDGAMIAGTNVDGNKKFASALNGQGSKMTAGQISQLIQSIESMGALMAATINTQTNTLKGNNLFGSGINGPTWS